MEFLAAMGCQYYMGDSLWRVSEGVVCAVSLMARESRNRNGKYSIEYMVYGFGGESKSKSPASFNPVATPDFFASRKTLALLDLTNAYLEFGATGHSHIPWFGQEIVAQSL